jgi:aspartyl-tRNA(Asn)/glutamyl-tRNA(Gln) amidotransferase subunit A
MNLNKLTLIQASEKLEAKEITSTQLVEDCLGAINANKDLNAFISVFGDEARELAKASDKRRATGDLPAGKAGKLSQFDGIPIAIKDNMAMGGKLTTAGSKILSNFKPPYDATVVKKLKDAGFIIIGKTNMDEFAFGSSTESSFFGPTKNPWNKTRVPGGSSGGSAAAVAADLVIAALGSDTGGSIRQPASFCGIVGLKPTYGAVSRYGLFAFGSSLDQIGPLTKTVEDAVELYNVIVGYDKCDSTSIKSQNVNLLSSTLEASDSQNDISNLKIGVPKEFFGEGLDPEVEKRIREGIKVLKKAGAEIIEVSLPSLKYALSVYYIVALAEASSNLSRYDGIKYGYSVNQRSKIKDQKLSLLDTYVKSRTEGFGTEAKRRIMLGTYILSAGYYDAYYKTAQRVRAKIKKELDEAFKKVDVLVGPVAPTTAFKIGEKIDDPLTMYLEDIYTVPVNPAGIPGVSVPCGMSDGLPVGLQILGPLFSENKIMSAAKAIEENIKFERQIGDGV